MAHSLVVRSTIIFCGIITAFSFYLGIDFIDYKNMESFETFSSILFLANSMYFGFAGYLLYKKKYSGWKMINAFYHLPGYFPYKYTLKSKWEDAKGEFGKMHP